MSEGVEGQAVPGYMEPNLLPDPQRDEDLLWSSQSGHWHVSSQAVRVVSQEWTEEERDAFVESFKQGDFEMVPVHLQVRNRQGRPIRVLSDWDGQHLMLDVATTEKVMLPPRAAAVALWRWVGGRVGAKTILALLYLLTLLSAYVIWVLFRGII